MVDKDLLNLYTQALSHNIKSPKLRSQILASISPVQYLEDIIIDDPPDNNQILNNKFSSELSTFLISLINLVYKVCDMNLKCKVDKIKNILTFNYIVEDYFNNKLKMINFKYIKPLFYQCKNIISNDIDYGGFIAEYNDTSFIILRGTAYKCDVLIDLEFKLINPYWIKNQNVKVHSGFNKMYTNNNNNINQLQNLKDQILSYLNSKNIKNIICAGHSLGGSLLSLLVYDLSSNYPELRKKLKIYTYGQPLTGNLDFVNMIVNPIPSNNYTGIFTIVNNNDIVPKLRNSEYVFNPIQTFYFNDTLSLDQIDSHKIENYYKNLKNLRIINLFNTNVNQNKKICGVNCNVNIKFLSLQEKQNKNQKIFIYLFIISFVCVIINFLLQNVIAMSTTSISMLLSIIFIQIESKISDTINTIYIIFISIFLIPTLFSLYTYLKSKYKNING